MILRESDEAEMHIYHGWAKDKWHKQEATVSDEMLERARFEAWFLISHRGLPKSSDMRKNSLWMAWQAGARAELLEAAKSLRERADKQLPTELGYLRRAAMLEDAEELERRAGGKP